MSLDNLLGISLERIDSDPFTIKRLLNAAQRNIEDADLEALSNENRFDVAYKAIMQLANAALQVNGFRTLTNKPGHHRTVIQTLPKTIGLDNGTMVVLDTLRKQRNAADYSGDPIAEGVTNECIEHARNLQKSVQNWLNSEHPGLLD